MAEFVYKLGMAIGRHRDEHRAYLKAFGVNLKIERTRPGLSQGGSPTSSVCTAPSTASWNAASAASTSWNSPASPAGLGFGSATCCQRHR